jgi:hypothetical protein
MFVLRNRLLGTSAVLFAPDNEGGATLTPEQEREAINVEVGTDKTKEANKDNNEENEENDDNKDDDEDNKDDEENKENDDETGEETEEEKAERVAKEKEEKEAKRIRKEERQQRKWDRLAAERNAALEEAERLRKQIAENNPDGLTEEEVERRAEEKANKKLQDKEAERKAREFDKSIRDLEIAAKKVDPKFDDKLNEMTAELDRKVPGEVISILSDLDHKNGGEVLNYLTENIDEADDIFDMSLHRMTQKLIRISDKLKDAKKDGKTSTRRQPPPPLNTVRESGRPESTTLTGKEDMDTFVRMRERQSEQYRKSKGGW